MFLSPLVSIKLRPMYYLVKQSRNVRPCVKIGSDKFELSVDVRNYKKDEITVRARTEYVIIEGKQEKKTKNGFVMRHFVRKFKLPKGCETEKMESKITPDGILTISAPRKISDESIPCETFIPIKYTESKENRDDPVFPIRDDVCSQFKGKSVPEDKKSE